MGDQGDRRRFFQGRTVIDNRFAAGVLFRVEGFPDNADRFEATRQIEFLRTFQAFFAVMNGVVGVNLPATRFEHIYFKLYGRLARHQTRLPR